MLPGCVTHTPVALLPCCRLTQALMGLAQQRPTLKVTHAAVLPHTRAARLVLAQQMHVPLSLACCVSAASPAVVTWLPLLTGAHRCGWCSATCWNWRSCARRPGCR